MFEQAHLYRVLAVDDEEAVRTEIGRQVAPIEHVDLVLAEGQAEAIELLDKHYFDAAIVDIELGDAPVGGYEVLRQMADRAPNATAVIATAFTKDLYGIIGMTEPRLSAIIRKGDHGEQWAAAAVREAMTEWHETAVDITNLELAVELLERRRRRISNARGGEELAIEVDRLCRQLFGNVTGLGDSSGVRVGLERIEREGLSAAITVQAEVQLGLDARGEPVRGSTCVLKLGPCRDIREEVERYQRFVKYGVRLRHRVELLGHAYDQALGAVCYSFAGGVFGESLVSLDEILRSPERAELFDQVLEGLFDLDSKNWYGVTGPPKGASTYVRGSYNMDFPHCYEVINGSSSKLANRFVGKVHYTKPEERLDGVLTVERWKLKVPKISAWTRGEFIRGLPTCLVHGDMHGGNVMVEVDESDAITRVCLIDYRSAGPGPRSADWLALEASVRLAEAQRIIEHAGAEREEDLDDAGILNALRAAARAVDQEQQLLTEIWDDAEASEHTSELWCERVRQVAARALPNFRGLDESEYMAMALPCAFRQLGYDIGRVSRVRMMAWVSALYARLPERSSGA